MKKIILMIAVILSIVNNSFATIYQIPHLSPSNINLNDIEDSVAVETLGEIANKKKTLKMPFIMAVAFSAKSHHPFYYDAKTMMDLDAYKKGTYIEIPTTRQPMSSIYFFLLKSPADTNFQYLCSGTDLFVKKDPKYTQIFNAYKNNNSSSIKQALEALTAKSFFTMPKIFNVSTKIISIETDTSVTSLKQGQFWQRTLTGTSDKPVNTKITIKCPTFKDVIIDMKKLKPGTLYVALDAGKFLFGSKTPQASKIDFKSMTKAEAQRAYPQWVK